MANNLQWYQKQQRYLYSQINQTKKSNGQLDREIARLDEAYNKVKRIKDESAKSLVNDTKPSNCKSGYKWRAKSKEKHDKYVEEDMKRTMEAFYKDVDRVLDSINNARNNKKNEKDTGSRTLNALIRSYNSVSTTIQNWFN